MKRTEKALLVEDLAARLKDAKSTVLVDYQGLPVKELNRLRDAVKAVGGQLIVVKNTLLKRALNQSQVTSHKSLPEEGLQGPTAVVFAEGDEIAPLQALGRSIADTELPKLKFGIFADTTYNAEKLLVLSRLPGREALYVQLLGTITGPKYRLVGVLQGNLQKLVYLLQAKSEARNNI